MAGPVTHCRACGARLAVTMADLGMQPPSNAFLASLQAAREEKRYPLRAKVCEACKLVQVDYDVAPEELFADYVYFSSYSEDWLAHAKRYCEMAHRRFGLDGRSLVVELASNDGYLLIPLRARPRLSACQPWSSSSASPSARASPARAAARI
jgi:hypothetical protein